VTRPPSGTVTFLFTDIQGSTKLWQSNPREMTTAVARHDALLKETVEANHGVVFKTVGDAVCAAFGTALDGLSAAVASQLALKAEPWPLPSPILVRMALHTGEAEERDADYFGPALNRVARLLAIGHGGQTLLSLVAAELVRDALPDGVSLREMGEHRLKDLYRPEMVYQVVHSGLASDFPALNSLDTHPHNLPLQPTPFIGREKELAEAARLLSGDGTRLLTVTGPGGMGKTRFALQAAAELIELFPNGVWFVDLAPLRDPAHLSGAIARVLRLKEDSGRPLIDALVDHLRGKRMLIVLDNFEQIMPAAANVARILSECPGIRMVVTSREALSLRGEQVLVLASLSLPTIDRRTPVAIGRLTQYEAVRLFIDRATAVEQGFHVTNESAPAVAEICVRLDGIPLAIELAAARIRLLSPQEILKRLDRRLQLLVAPMRDLPERQRTLRAAIGWSHDLLDPAEKAVFRTVAVFCSGFSLDAGETVCAEVGLEGGVLDRLESLAAKSLLLKDTAPGGGIRLRMLETIREFGLERLVKEHEEDKVRDAHAGCFAGLLSRAELEGPNQKMWLDRIEVEYENIRAALDRFERSGAVQKLAEVACALTPFWDIRCRATEGNRWLSRAMGQLADLPDPMRAQVLQSAGIMARQAGEYEKSVSLLEKALALFRQIGDEHGEARALCHLGRTLYRKNDLHRASTAALEAMEISLRFMDVSLAANCGLGIGLVEWRSGHLDAAAKRFTQCHSLFHLTGFLREEAQSLSNLGLIHCGKQAYSEGLSCFLGAFELQKKLDDHDGLRNVLNNVADTSLKIGDFMNASDFYCKLLELSNGDGDARGASTAFAGLAEVQLVLGNSDQAKAYARRSLEEAKSTGRGVEVGVACRVLGDIALVASMPQEARKWYEKSISILEPIQEADELRKARCGKKAAHQL
jgi:predicted ATPase/class 3 adenylate cyclase